MSQKLEIAFDKRLINILAPCHWALQTSLCTSAVLEVIPSSPRPFKVWEAGMTLPFHNTLPPASLGLELP